jgi:hypothetical protein
VATTDWLGAPPDDCAGLAMWALARIAARAAESGIRRALVRRTRCGEADLDGRFGCGLLGPTPAAGPVSDELVIAPGRARPADHGDPAVRALFDPVVLIRDIGTVSARPGTRLGRPCVKLDVRPHPSWADPNSPWCPPGAQRTLLTVDAATGVLLEAELVAGSTALARYQILDLDTPVAPLPERAAVRSGAWRAPLPAPVDRGGWALARMAATLLEPVMLTAEVEILIETRKLAFNSAPSVTQRRVWTIGVTAASEGLGVPAGTARVLTMGDDYVPGQVPAPIARLAELLTPARIVSHLTEVTAVPAPDTGRPCTRITAAVRPDRGCPAGAWVPDETVTCAFTVDQTTGVLLSAESRAADGELLARYRINALRSLP